ncbi:unnamed protein product [Candidula unifasciata]|uniref:MICOS complex subunit MIC13 n=1 Tax=Candidula unifasciata TaxID=100452 RepID=A0A8S3ZCB8_9EUPU|nr:unnamed protein product [Candidula unifasciata]
MALGVAKIAAKVSAVGGVLYWSVQQGIWGSSKEGSEAGKKLTRTFVEPAKKCIEKIPSLTDISSKEYWNSGVSSWLNSVSQLSDMGRVPTQKSKSASSL